MPLRTTSWSSTSITRSRWLSVRSNSGQSYHAAPMPPPMDGDEVFGELLEAMPDGMVMVDESGRIVFVNRQLEQLSGYVRAELIGRRIEKLVPDRFRPDHRGGR